MIAELKGKVSSTHSNLTERLEDELTGNFFGNMRYLSFNKWLKAILMCCIEGCEDCAEVSAQIGRIDADEWHNSICFWDKDNESEIDVIIRFDEIIIGIEVKYKTPPAFGEAVDAADNSGILDSRQFVRESRTLANMPGSKNKLLILLADETNGRNINSRDVASSLADGVSFAHITWQDVLIEFENLKALYKPISYEGVIVEDLLALLKSKGFERFADFEVKAIQDINPELIWMFDYEINKGFGFEINKKIEKGLYYEFG